MKVGQDKEIGFVRFVNRLSGWAGGLAAIFLFLITITIIGDAFMRTLFNQPLRFGPDLLGFLAIYMILLPCAMALRNKRQVDVSLVFDKLPPRMKRFVSILTLIIGLIVFAITTVYGFQLTADSIKGGLKSNSPFGMKLWYSQLGVFIAFALLCLQIIAKMILEVFRPEPERED